MTADRPASLLASLVHELCACRGRPKWVELKVDDAEPEAIGEYISALANALRETAGRRVLDGYLIRDPLMAVVTIASSLFVATYSFTANLIGA